jgi:hypothetical protein
MDNAVALIFRCVCKKIVKSEYKYRHVWLSVRLRGIIPTFIVPCDKFFTLLYRKWWQPIWLSRYSDWVKGWTEEKPMCVSSGFRCMLMKYALSCGTTQRRVMVRRFGTTLRAHLQGERSPSSAILRSVDWLLWVPRFRKNLSVASSRRSLKMGPMCYPEISV